MFLSDYHTHTIFSHGKGTIEDNVSRAEELGLKEVAITDHGLFHIIFGLRKWKLKKMREIINEIQPKYNVKILLGVESNLMSQSGKIDIPNKYWKYFDIVLCGFHKAVFNPNFFSWLTFVFKNLFIQFTHIKQGEKLIKKNTQALINCIKRNKIDILSHVNHDMKVNAVEVAKVAKEYGTMFEINCKKQHLDIETWKEVAKTGVTFVVDSDAHEPNRVGEFSLAEEVISKAKIDRSQIANWDKLPTLKDKTSVI